MLKNYQKPLAFLNSDTLSIRTYLHYYRLLHAMKQVVIIPQSRLNLVGISGDSPEETTDQKKSFRTGVWKTSETTVKRRESLS